MGRRFNINREQFDDVIELISSGMTTKKACEKVGVEKNSFYSFKKVYELDNLYAQAKIEQLEILADELIDLADEDLKTDPDGRFSNADVQKQRLRVDTRKFLFAKLLSKFKPDFNNFNSKEEIEIEI